MNFFVIIKQEIKQSTNQIVQTENVQVIRKAQVTRTKPWFFSVWTTQFNGFLLSSMSSGVIMLNPDLNQHHFLQAVEGGPLNRALPGCSDLLREKEGVGWEKLGIQLCSLVASDLLCFCAEIHKNEENLFLQEAETEFPADLTLFPLLTL